MVDTMGEHRLVLEVGESERVVLPIPEGWTVESTEQRHVLLPEQVAHVVVDGFVPNIVVTVVDAPEQLLAEDRRAAPVMSSTVAAGALSWVVEIGLDEIAGTDLVQLNAVLAAGRTVQVVSTAASSGWSAAAADFDRVLDGARIEGDPS